MKNRIPQPALANSGGAPFQMQVVFPQILENSERLYNIECFQRLKSGAGQQLQVLEVLPNLRFSYLKI